MPREIPGIDTSDFAGSSDSASDLSESVSALQEDQLLQVSEAPEVSQTLRPTAEQSGVAALTSEKPVVADDDALQLDWEDLDELETVAEKAGPAATDQPADEPDADLPQDWNQLVNEVMDSATAEDDALAAIDLLAEGEQYDALLKIGLSPAIPPIVYEKIVDIMVKAKQYAAGQLHAKSVLAAREAYRLEQEATATGEKHEVDAAQALELKNQYLIAKINFHRFLLNFFENGDRMSFGRTFAAEMVAELIPEDTILPAEVVDNEVMAALTLSSLGITEAIIQRLKQDLEEEFGKPFTFNLTPDATLEHLRQALDDQHFFEKIEAPTAPEAFDAAAVARQLAESTFGPEKGEKDVSAEDLMSMITSVAESYEQAASLLTEECRNRLLDTLKASLAELKTDLFSFSEEDRGEDINEYVTAYQFREIVSSDLLRFKPIEVSFEDVTELEKRLYLVFVELSKILTARKAERSKSPPEAPAAPEAFDAAAVAQTLAENTFGPAKDKTNVSGSDLTAIVAAAADGLPPETSLFIESFAEKLREESGARYRSLREALYLFPATEESRHDLVRQFTNVMTETGKPEVLADAQWEDLRGRVGKVVTQLYTILAERVDQAERSGKKASSTSFEATVTGAVPATSGEGRDISTSPPLLITDLEQPVGRNPGDMDPYVDLEPARVPARRNLEEETAKLAAANRAILIERAKHLLGYDHTQGDQLDRRMGWNDVLFELQEKIEKTFGFHYSQEGKDRLKGIVFNIFNNVDTMENEYILRMFPEVRGESGELCAYGFDIDDEQSQKATVEYLVEIAAKNECQTVSELLRYYGQRFAKLILKIEDENTLSYTPNGERLLNGEASALHFVASVAGILFLSEKGLLTDELLKNAETETIKKYIQQKRWEEALKLLAYKDIAESDPQYRLILAALVAEYGIEFTAAEKTAITKIDSSTMIRQLYNIRDLPYAGLDEVLNASRWQAKSESLCFSLAEACGYGQNAELPPQFNQALNKFMSRIFKQEVMVQLAPADRNFKQKAVGFLKTHRLTSKLKWVRERWGSEVRAIDKGLKFSLLRASEVPEAEVSSSDAAHEEITQDTTDEVKVKPKNTRQGQLIAEAPSPFRDPHMRRTLLDRIRRQAAKKPDIIDENWFEPFNLANDNLSFGRDADGKWRDKDKQKRVEAEAAEVETDEYDSALREVEEILAHAGEYDFGDEQERNRCWGVVAETFSELKEIPDEEVREVATRLAAQLAAFLDLGVMPPEAEAENLPFEQARFNLVTFLNAHEDDTELADTMEARKILFTYWRSMLAAPIPADDARAKETLKNYNLLLAAAVGTFASNGWFEGYEVAI